MTKTLDWIRTLYADEPLILLALEREPKIQECLRRTDNAWSAYLRGLVTLEVTLEITKEEAIRAATLLAAVCETPEFRALAKESV